MAAIFAMVILPWLATASQMMTIYFGEGEGGREANEMMKRWNWLHVCPLRRWLSMAAWQQRTN